MPNRKVRVLVIEGDADRSERYFIRLTKAGFEVDQLKIDSESKESFDFTSFLKDDDQWDVVVLDSNFDGQSTVPLIPLLRDKFGDSVLIFANSNLREESRSLKDAGCDIQLVGKARSFSLAKLIIIALKINALEKGKSLFFSQTLI